MGRMWCINTTGQESSGLLGAAHLDRKYGAFKEANNVKMENLDTNDKDKNVKDYFIILDRSMKENIKNAEKVSENILKILAKVDKLENRSSKETLEDFTSIAANILVNF